MSVKSVHSFERGQYHIRFEVIEKDNYYNPFLLFFQINADPFEFCVQIRDHIDAQ